MFNFFKKKNSVETEWIKESVADINKTLSDGKLACLKYGVATHPNFWNLGLEIELLNSKPDWFNTRKAKTEDLVYCQTNYHQYTNQLIQLYRTFPGLKERLFRELVFGYSSGCDDDHFTLCTGFLKEISEQDYDNIQRLRHRDKKAEELLSPWFENKKCQTNMSLSFARVEKLMLSRLSAETNLSHKNFGHLGFFSGYVYAFYNLFNHRECSYEETAKLVEASFIKLFGYTDEIPDHCGPLNFHSLLGSPSLSFSCAIRIYSNFNYDCAGVDEEHPLTRMNEQFDTYHDMYNMAIAAILRDNSLTKQRVSGLDFQGERTIFFTNRKSVD